MVVAVTERTCFADPKHLGLLFKPTQTYNRHKIKIYPH